LTLDAGTEAKEVTYTYNLNLLQLITTLVHSPDAQDQAMLEIFTGLKQGSELVQVYLQKCIRMRLESERKLLHVAELPVVEENL